MVRNLVTNSILCLQDILRGPIGHFLTIICSVTLIGIAVKEWISLWLSGILTLGVPTYAMLGVGLFGIAVSIKWTEPFVAEKSPTGDQGTVKDFA